MQGGYSVGSDILALMLIAFLAFSLFPWCQSELPITNMILVIYQVYIFPKSRKGCILCVPGVVYRIRR